MYIDAVKLLAALVIFLRNIPEGSDPGDPIVAVLSATMLLHYFWRFLAKE